MASMKGQIDDEGATKHNGGYNKGIEWCGDGERTGDVDMKGGKVSRCSNEG